MTKEGFRFQEAYCENTHYFDEKLPRPTAMFIGPSTTEPGKVVTVNVHTNVPEDHHSRKTYKGQVAQLLRPVMPPFRGEVRPFRLRHKQG